LQARHRLLLDLAAARAQALELCGLGPDALLLGAEPVQL